MEVSSVECRKCHAEMFDGARFCIRCGSALEGVASVTTRTLTSRPPAPFSELLSPSNPAAPGPASATSLSEAMGNAVQQAEESWSAPAEPDTRTLSLAEMAADLATVAAKAPLAGTADPIRRQEEKMVDLSRDEVLRRARVKQSMKRAGLAGMDLAGVNLEGVDFGRADLEGANLENAKLRGAILRSANLRGAKLRGADLAEADLDKADLEDAELEGVFLAGAQLKRASLVSARLGNANLTGADLTGAELDFADLTGSNLKNAALCFAELTEATLRNVDLSQADARHALFKD
ncbi:MAG TPA: pentapeptide repeat-containing protein, partial [Polyangiaceae bacterium]